MIGYIFLGQCIVMVLLVIWLFVVTLREGFKERRDRLRGIRTESVSKELCVYATVSVFFALSYIGRYIINEHFIFCSD